MEKERLEKQIDSMRQQQKQSSISKSVDSDIQKRVHSLQQELEEASNTFLVKVVSDPEYLA